MTSTNVGYRWLLTVCWLSLFAVLPNMLPVASAQEQPPRPKQAKVDAAATNAVDAAAEGGVVDDANKDVAVQTLVEEEKEIVEIVQLEFAMDAGAQDPQMLLLIGYARVNCALARRACTLSEGEEQKLSQLNTAWIDKQVKESISAPAIGVVAGIARFLGGRAAAAEVQNINGDPQQIAIPKVKKKIDIAIEEALEPEHREAYQRERESREEFRKRALAAVLVSSLDERVFLTQQQRDDLEPEVDKWLTKDLYWQFYFQNANYIPDIPKRVLSKVLSGEQLEALNGAQAWNYEVSQIELQMMREEPVMIER